jgi:hypothetical protein
VLFLHVLGCTGEQLSRFCACDLLKGVLMLWLPWLLLCCFTRCTVLLQHRCIDLLPVLVCAA